MKKTLILFVVALTVGFSSCSKDDETTEASLLGKWQVQQTGVVIAGQEVLQDAEFTEGCTKDYSIIAASTISQHDFVKENNECVEEISLITYTRSGNTLTINDNGNVLVGKIVILNATTLKISAEIPLGEGQPTTFISVMKRI